MQGNNNRPVGVFDSGIGGLTVVREIMGQLPEEKIIYFGDTARLPYGSKSRDTVIGYARQIKNFLLTKEVKAIVIACNTASAHALSTLEAECDIPVIGVIHAGARAAVEASRNGSIGVIGTQGTITSNVYLHTMKEMRDDIRVVQRACPLFVPMAEEGLCDARITEDVAHMYLDDMRKQGVDTLVMGCTHYPLLVPAIGKVMGDGVVLVNPAYETARELREILESKGLLSYARSGNHEYYASDLAYRVKDFAGSILPDEDINAVKIDITGY